MVMKPLQKGDTIGLFSPSSPASAFAPLRYNRAKLFLTSKGYRVKEGDLMGKRQAYRSGTILERAAELNALIQDKDVTCIMSTIGGMNSNSILPYIDYDAFNNNPKIIVGYSDVTAILLAIYAKTGITTFYGPAVVASLGELPPFVNQTWEAFENLVSNQMTYTYTPEMPHAWTEEFINWEEQNRSKTPRENNWISLGNAVVRGRLIGGNLNTLQGFWGSPYMPAIEKDDILLLEDSLKKASTVERSFSFLKVNGVFDKIAGIVLGKHELYDDEGSGLSPLDLLLEVLNGQSMPILAEYDACHTHPMITLPIGGMVELDTQKGQLTLLNSDFWRGATSI